MTERWTSQIVPDELRDLGARRGSRDAWDRVASQLNEGLTLQIEGVTRAAVYSALIRRGIKIRMNQTANNIWIIWKRLEL